MFPYLILLPVAAVGVAVASAVIPDQARTALRSAAGRIPTVSLGGGSGSGAGRGASVTIPETPTETGVPASPNGGGPGSGVSDSPPDSGPPAETNPPAGPPVDPGPPSEPPGKGGGKGPTNPRAGRQLIGELHG